MDKNEKIKIVKINKLKISNLFYEMKPLREPNLKVKFLKNHFLNECIKKKIPLKEKSQISERKSLPKIKIKKLKYVHDHSVGNMRTDNRSSSISPEKNVNYNSTASIRESLKNKYLILNTNNTLRKKYKSKYIYRNREPLFNNKTSINYIIEKKDCNINKFGNKKIKILNLKKNKSNLNKKMINRNNNNMLPKITKKFINPFLSEEVKDIISLKQYEMREIGEALKMRPFIH